MKSKPFAEQDIKTIISETIAYAETNICRRNACCFIFGETSENDNCNCCDNCLHPKPKNGRKRIYSNIAVYHQELKQQFKDKHIN